MLTLRIFRTLLGLNHIEREIMALVRAQERMMAKFEDVESLVAALNDATNVIAAKLDALAAQIAAGGLSSGQEDQIVSELGSLRDRLVALGADPSNPV